MAQNKTDGTVYPEMESSSLEVFKKTHVDMALEDMA